MWILCRFLSVSLLIVSLSSIGTGQNGSVLFDGGNGRLGVTNLSPINPEANPSAYQISGTAITVEAWAYPLGFPWPQCGNTIVAHWFNNVRGGRRACYALEVLHGNGFPQAHFRISAEAPESEVGVLCPDTLPVFQWTHLAATYDGETIKLYVNGDLRAQVSSSISITSSGYCLYIGGSPIGGAWTSPLFQGAIDEARLWNVARNKNDIQSSMNVQLVGNEIGLVGYWNMNSVAFVNGRYVFQDQTVNHNDLQLLGRTRIIPFNPLATYGIPTCALNPTSMDLGILEQGAATSLVVTISNSSASPLIGIFRPGSEDLQVTGGATFCLAPGQTAAVTVFLRPMEPGALSSSLDVQINAPPVLTLPVTVTSIALRRFDANKIAMWTQRNGIFASSPFTAPYFLSGQGFEWPKGTGKYAIYSAGIWIGATVGGAPRTATAFYRSEFAPGPIIDGVASDPNDTTYRVYKIRAGDNAATNADYASWPVNLGAPVNPDGSPKVIGDQTLFVVYNDLSPANHFLGSQPLGAEVQQTIFGFNQPDVRDNTVFLRFRVINKSSTTWNNTYVALWSDPDLGYAFDDLAGVDTSRNLGFIYNGTNLDAIYGTAPPAAGYSILKGAFFTKPIQAFAYFTNGAPYPRRDPNTYQQAYHFLQGRWADGSPYIDPATGLTTTFALSGDPVTGSGWIDSPPVDQRFLLSTGPFDLEPGQSKEMIAAIIVGQGTSNLNSITVLRDGADVIKSMFDAGEIFGGALENVASATASEGGTSTVDDLENSGAQLTVTGGTGGATVEAASYIDEPPGAESITTPSIGGVGKYLDVQVQGTVQWPVQIRIYYARNDLLQAEVVESDLQGLYYWRGLTDQWVLYSDSGVDDQGRGPSTTGVDTTNVFINNVQYEGYVYASAYHLTPIVAGAKKKSIAQRYEEAIQLIQSLPDGAFKKPAEQRRAELADKFAASKSLYISGNVKAALQKLQQDITNHLTPQGNSGQNLWITDAAARVTLLRMVNDLIDLLQRPQSLGKGLGARSASTGDQLIPSDYSLSQNYPNPFNPSTTIRFQLPKAAHVVLQVFDVLGRLVATLVDREMQPGFYRVQWTSQLPSGMYFYRIQADDFVDTKKLLLLR